MKITEDIIQKFISAIEKETVPNMVYLSLFQTLVKVKKKCLVKNQDLILTSVSNSIANRCQNINIANRCQNINTANRCQNINIANRCQNINIANRCQNINIANRCQNINIANRCQNINITRFLQEGHTPEGE